MLENNQISTFFNEKNLWTL